jgi:hypothetical protein
LQFRSVDVSSNSKPSSDHLYAFFDCIIDRETKTYLSEDYSFCQRWRTIGGEIWLDLNSKLVHSGVQHFAGNTTLRYSAVVQEALAQAQDVYDLDTTSIVDDSDGGGRPADGDRRRDAA